MDNGRCVVNSRCRGGGRDEQETRFVYGRYRQPTGGRLGGPYPHHQHQLHHAHHAHHGPPTHNQDEEGIYETADHDRGNHDQCGDTPDSER